MAVKTRIREHMEVIGSDGAHIGTVDHLSDDGRIKLAKSDSPDGKHHFISQDIVDHVDEHVHLSVSSSEAMDEWEEGDDDTMELEDDESVDEDEEEVAR